jgi:hypothetical protein
MRRTESHLSAATGGCDLLRTSVLCIFPKQGNLLKVLTSPTDRFGVLVDPTRIAQENEQLFVTRYHEFRSIYHLLAELRLLCHFLPDLLALTGAPPLKPLGQSNHSYHGSERSARSDEEAYLKHQACKKHCDLHCCRVKLSVVAESFTSSTVALSDFLVIES